MMISVLVIFDEVKPGALVIAGLFMAFLNR